MLFVAGGDECAGGCGFNIGVSVIIWGPPHDMTFNS